MKAYDCILIDWNGTIENTVPLRLAAYRDTFEGFSLHPTEKEIMEKAYCHLSGPRKLSITE